MSKDIQNIAQHEIHKTLGLCNFCTRKVGLSFIDVPPKSPIGKIGVNLWLLLSAIVLFLMSAGEVGYVTDKLITSSSVEEFVSSLHIVGYDIMSFGKLLTIWYKRNVFKHLLKDLEDIWPVSVHDKKAAEIKRERLSALRIGQFWYAFWNILGVWLYNLTPIIVYLYRKIQGKSAALGYIWLLCYPFDKTKPGYHEFSFVFEAYGGGELLWFCIMAMSTTYISVTIYRTYDSENGVVSVWCMIGSDMLFMTMASHISMLLQILQVQIRRLGTSPAGIGTNVASNEMQDCYSEIVSVVKIHQRLITYGNDLEDAFSVVNLINVLLSSVNICCVVFNILLDPWMAMSNKFFLGAALTQVGILCWYANEIYTSSSGVGDAVYESGWYNTNKRCQRTLLLLMQRSQKPLYFTAFKFRSITMSTYSSILTTSYSYFTLLYTVYRSD